MAGFSLNVAVRAKSPDEYIGKQITAMARVSPGIVVLQLHDGSQLQFRVVDGAIEVGAHVESKH
jgi:hypothetical protein